MSVKKKVLNIKQTRNSSLRNNNYKECSKCSKLDYKKKQVPMFRSEILDRKQKLWAKGKVRVVEN